MKKQISVKTSSPREVLNVTEAIAREVGDVKRGLLLVNIPHTTAAIFLAEDDDELREDYIKIAENTFAGLRPFKHIRKQNPNTEAHAFSSLFGSSLTLLVEDGALGLGTYQNVLFLEMDGPKERTLELNLFG
jgi:secondary thiamine-phosphate synthase enzyme